MATGSDFGAILSQEYLTSLGPIRLLQWVRLGMCVWNMGVGKAPPCLNILLFFYDDDVVPIKVLKQLSMHIQSFSELSLPIIVSHKNRATGSSSAEEKMSEGGKCAYHVSMPH